MSTNKNLQNLSFVKSTTTRRVFWRNAKSHEFTTSIEIGKKMATEYLQYLQIDGQAPILASVIFEIVRISSITKLNEPQIIGFFTTIEAALKANLGSITSESQKFTRKDHTS